MVGPDGRPSSSKVSEKLLFRDHFGAQLSGCGTSFANLHQHTLDDLSDLSWAGSGAGGAGAAALVPGVCELAKLFKKASLVACGEDRICGQLCCRFPRIFSCLYFPLIFKSICLASPPLQWRGGVLHELFKNKGSSAFLCNYRDIMLGSVPGKVFTKRIRSHALPAAHLLCGPSQFGSDSMGVRQLSPICMVAYFMITVFFF